MSTIFMLLMVILMVIAVLLVVIVMAQNPKGGGLSSAFGGTSSAQFGVQRTNDFMEKSTWVLATTICVLIILSIVMTAKPSSFNTTPKVQKTTHPVPQSGQPTTPQNTPAK